MTPTTCSSAAASRQTTRSSVPADTTAPGRSRQLREHACFALGEAHVVAVDEHGTTLELDDGASESELSPLAFETLRQRAHHQPEPPDRWRDRCLDAARARSLGARRPDARGEHAVSEARDELGAHATTVGDGRRARAPQAPT